MKKIIIGCFILLLAPIIAFSAPNLAAKLQGKILLAVEDKGKTYYVHTDGNRYQITKETALEIFKKLAVGIKNTDLEQIPIKDVGIAPEVAGVKISECPATEKIVYSQSDCSLYTNQITQLMKDKAALQNNTNSLNKTTDDYSAMVIKYEQLMKEAINTINIWKTNAEQWKAKATANTVSSPTLNIRCIDSIGLECYTITPDLQKQINDLIANSAGRGITSGGLEPQINALIRNYYK